MNVVGRVNVVGLLEKCEVKPGGFHDFWIDGNKYGTKRAEIIAAAQELMGQRVEATVNESASDKVNSYTGQPYINRYLESVVPAAGPPQVAAGPSGHTVAAQPGVGSSGDPPLPAPPPVNLPEERELRIMRQTATKVAASMLPHLDPELRSMESMVILADKLLDYYVRGEL